MYLLYRKTFNKSASEQVATCIPIAYQLSDREEIEDNLLNTILCINSASLKQSSIFKHKLRLQKLTIIRWVLETL
jgi:putative exporter of polyketide antibiotics